MTRCWPKPAPVRRHRGRRSEPLLGTIGLSPADGCKDSGSWDWSGGEWLRSEPQGATGAEIPEFRELLSRLHRRNFPQPRQEVKGRAFTRCR